MKKITLIATLIILLAGSVLTTYYLKSNRPFPAPEKTGVEETPVETPTGESIRADFVCADGKNISATFYNGSDSRVEISLSDGRSFSLAQTISASGARYANNDESIIFWNKGNSAFIEENGQNTYDSCLTADESRQPINAGLANPASTNCVENGGRTVIQAKEDGSQYGLCYFDDNRACEEWAMFRGDCPVGGIKTTGYDTPAQKFCAWSGGKTLAVENATCTFSDGTVCPAEDFYLGTCQDKSDTE